MGQSKFSQAQLVESMRATLIRRYDDVNNGVFVERLRNVMTLQGLINNLEDIRDALATGSQHCRYCGRAKYAQDMINELAKFNAQFQEEGDHRDAPLVLEHEDVAYGDEPVSSSALAAATLALS